MKKKYFIWLLGLFILLAISVIGVLFPVWKSIYDFSHFLGVIFFIFVFSLIGVLLIYPIIKVFLTPEMKGTPYENIIRMNSQELNEYVKKIHLNKDEKKSYQSSFERITTLTNIIENRKKQLDGLVHDYATTVFLATSISQIAAIDFVSNIILSFKLIQKIIEKYGRRPSYVQLLRLYTSVVTSSTIITSIDQILDDIDISTITETLGGLTTSFLKSGLNGIANALVCLRIGYCTIRYLEVGEHEFKLNKAKYRKEARTKALKSVTNIAKEGILRLSSISKQAIEKI